MTHRYKNYLIFIFAGILVGCATSLSKTELANIKTIGILNTFQDKPTWTVNGSAVFTVEMNETEPGRYEVEPGGFKQYLAAVTTDYLVNKGYRVITVSDLDALKSGKVDLVLELHPRDVFQLAGTKGYGFVQKTVMGIPQAPQAYIALNIEPETNSGARLGNFWQEFYVEHFEPVGLNEMPATWDTLTAEQKTMLAKSLRVSIDKAVNEVLPRLGF